MYCQDLAQSLKLIFTQLFLFSLQPNLPARRLRGVRGSAKLTRFDEQPTSEIQFSEQVDGETVSTATSLSRWQLLTQHRTEAVEKVPQDFGCQCHQTVAIATWAATRQAVKNS